eukprot:1459021-Prymnesium_polylepis.1
MTTVSETPSTAASPPTPSLTLASEANVTAPVAPVPIGRRDNDSEAPLFRSRTERATASRIPAPSPVGQRPRARTSCPSIGAQPCPPPPCLRSGWEAAAGALADFRPV